jgi:hypothetical protein
MVFEFCSRARAAAGVTVDFDNAYDRYFPAFEDCICGGTCARLSFSVSVEEYELEEFA